MNSLCQILMRGHYINRRLAMDTSNIPDSDATNYSGYREVSIEAQAKKYSRSRVQRGRGH